MAKRYTPGYSSNAVEFMAARTAHTHAGFLTPYLRPGLNLLDCGCGPGSISFGLAAGVNPGHVIAVDSEESQVERARELIRRAPITNLTFQVADAYALPFEDDTFDVVFSHALLEHLSRPLAALREFRRVLKPSATVGVCSPDWGGFIVAPSIPGLAAALDTYMGLMRSNGAQPFRGRELGGLLAEAGFRGITLSARYECYASRERIASYLAQQLEAAADLPGESREMIYRSAAAIFRDWFRHEPGLFAQAWVAAIGRT
jgi:SAM-dependent methyltransferase